VGNKILKSMYKSVLQKFDLRALFFVLVLSVHVQPGKKNIRVTKSFLKVSHSICSNTVISKSKYIAETHTFSMVLRRGLYEHMRGLNDFSTICFKIIEWKVLQEMKLFKRKESKFNEKF